MIVDHPLVSRKLFYPRSSDVEPTLVVDVPDAKLACFHCQRYPEAGVLLYFHGNGELAADYATDWAEMFLAMGINVCFAEYRGYGASTGVPTLGGMLADGAYIVQALGVPPERIVAFGRSLGCVYAVELARRLPQLAGLILESGRANVLDSLGPLVGEVDKLSCTEAELVAEIETHFNHPASMQSYKGRLLVLHTRNDGLIDSSNAERLHAWAGGKDKQLVIFPEGNHNTILFANYLEYVGVVKAFLERTGVLNGGAASPDRLQPGPRWQFTWEWSRRFLRGLGF